MKEWVPLNADGTRWALGEAVVARVRKGWVMTRTGGYVWPDPYLAGAARVAEALEGDLELGGRLRGGPGRPRRAMKRRFLPACAHPRMRYCCPKPCGHLICPDCGLSWDEGAEK